MSIDVNLNLGTLTSVGLTIPSSTVTPTPGSTSATPNINTTVSPNLITRQMQVPIKDANGAVVKWVTQTIEYDSNLTNPPGSPKSYVGLAPWSVQYRIVSQP